MFVAQERKMIPEVDRRRILQGLSLLLGSAALPQVAHALVKGGGRGLELLNPFFTRAQRRTVAALSERIMPTSDTPGAIAAKVPEFIEMMLGDWYEAADRAAFIRDLAALDSYSRSKHKARFAALPAKSQDEVITVAMNKALPGASPEFFEHSRQLVVTGYFRSEIGATVEQVYLPVPGMYDPYYPYEKVGRILSG
jgi:gluconate 2-dehydrogenase gamma chain